MRKFTLRISTLLMFLAMGTFVMAQYPVTFNVDLNEVEGFNADTTEIFMAGDFLGWATPGSNPDYMMAPTIEDPLVYTLKFDFPEGDTVFQYKYFFVYNGIESWNGGEWEGTDNRIIAVTDTVTLNDIWADRPAVVTFNVDMTDAADFNPETDEVYMAGTINLANGWVMPGEAPFYKMELSAEKEMIYTKALSLYLGDYAYKYFRVIDGEPSWDHGEWAKADRLLTVDTTMTVNNIWGDPSAINNPTEGPIVSISPNPCQSFINITFFENMNDITKVEVYNIVGAVVKTIDGFSNHVVTINTADLTNGVYFVAVHNASGVQTTKFIKN
ncbi:MAG: hypothetical protein B6I19_04860 [Bacteroidetes bacterium 4572_114]|nr:MAG: hypothetical protein B6I19_04860 [Bacteroidetes bacterium 4572_114]